MYLNKNQLADLIECSPNSFACMCRWLQKNDWPFAISKSGFPKVSVIFHDSLLNGKATKHATELEPDFGAIT